MNNAEAIDLFWEETGTYDSQTWDLEAKKTLGRTRWHIIHRKVFKSDKGNAYYVDLPLGATECQEHDSDNVEHGPCKAVSVTVIKYEPC